MDKICVVVNDYPSKGRPVYVFVEQLVNAIADMNQEICVVAPQSITKSFIRNIPLRPKRQEYITGKGNSYMVFRPYILTFGKQRKYLYNLVNWFNRWSIEKFIGKAGPQILYAHFWNNAIRVMDYAEKKNIPVFVACGEGDDAMEDMIKTLSSKEKKDLVNIVKGVISVSSVNKSKCINYGLAEVQNIEVLPNAIDEKLFYPRDKNLELRNKLGVKNDDFLVLFVGSFTRRKGCDRLAKAIRLLHDDKIKVMFVGGPLSGETVDTICPNIVFKDSLNHDMLPEYYACADVFVLPTRKEGCCNAIVEALAMGIPVISSCESFNDDILDENNSIRIDPMDIDAIAAAILKMKNDKAFYKHMKEYLCQSRGNTSIEHRASKIIDFIAKHLTQK